MKRFGRIAAGGCLLAFGLALGLITLAVIARSWGEVVTFREAGLCVEAPDPSYGMEGSNDAENRVLDFSNDKGARMRIQLGSDLPLDSAIIDVAKSQPGIFVPVANDADRYVAAEAPPSELIVYLQFEGVDETERKRLLSGVRLCPETTSTP